jgi:hypothetical protein
MRYRLRTLLILLAILPPLLAIGWFAWEAISRQETDGDAWTSELSLIHGSGQTVEPDEDARPPDGEPRR